MKRILIATLALALTACSAVVTVQPTPVPPTAQVVIATVLVTAVPTEAPPTAVPTATPVPTNTPEPIPTEAPTEAAAPTEPPAATGGELIIPPDLGGSLFTSMKASSDAFSLRCLPQEITFNVTTENPYVVNVYLYYRIEDREGTYITEWKNGGLMDPQEQGVFTRVFKGEDIHPDWRKHLAWFDVQFVGVNKSDEVVGRSEKIVQLITYTIDCQ